MPTILIVDADEESTEKMTDILATAGHIPVVVTNGARARQLLATERDFDLMVIDHQLDTAETGLEFLAEMRSNAFTRRLPALICTRASDRSIVTRFLSLEIAGFLAKPFRRARFADEVQGILNAARAKELVTA